MLDAVNLKTALNQERERIKSFSLEELFTKAKIDDEKPTGFDMDLLEKDRVYHISQIKNLCIKYRLRFLDATFYKGDFPVEAIDEIQYLEELHSTNLNEFRIAAPSKFFSLKNADDPLLFVPMGNDYYYFVHQWGKDLHPLRKLAVWPLRNLENFMVSVVLLSILLTSIMPKEFIFSDYSSSEYLLLFMFMVKWIAGIALYYGFSKGKNFNAAIWKSQYFNA
ncbi:MAG: hypothetical protein ACQESK_03070 [Bacteroidota bacterium]